VKTGGFDKKKRKPAKSKIDPSLSNIPVPEYVFFSNMFVYYFCLPDQGKIMRIYIFVP